jgi:hypothetical protein
MNDKIDYVLCIYVSVTQQTFSYFSMFLGYMVHLQVFSNYLSSLLSQR